MKLRNIYKASILASLLVSLALFTSCDDTKEKAQLKLEQARKYYEAKDYDLAREEIDSITILYPKAFEERRMARAFLDTVRHAMDEQMIEQVDTELKTVALQADELKKKFTFVKNEEYQDLGVYFPKSTYNGGNLSYNTLRSGVREDGLLFLESIYIGGQKHNSIELSLRNVSLMKNTGNDESYKATIEKMVSELKEEVWGEKLKTEVNSKGLVSFTIQSGKVTDEGANNRFTTLGKQFEVIRFFGENENGIARLIAEFPVRTAQVKLLGAGTTTVQLNSNQCEAIKDSYLLSKYVVHMDSLNEERNKAEFRIRYLENKDEVNAINKELKENGQKLRNVD